MHKYQELLNPEALQTSYQAATTPNERRRWQVLLLLAVGTPVAEIVAVTGYRPRTIRAITQRYAKAGAAAMVDQRAHARGATPILSARQQVELYQLLQNAPLDGGKWTGTKVAQWMAAKLGKPVHRQRGWEYLRRLQAIDREESASN